MWIPSVAARGKLAPLEARAKLGKRGGLFGHAGGDQLRDGVAAVGGVRVGRFLRAGCVRLLFVERGATSLEGLGFGPAARRHRRRRGRLGRWRNRVGRRRGGGGCFGG